MQLYVLAASRVPKSLAMRTYVECSCKSRGIRTYKIIGLKLPCNETLTVYAGGVPLALPQTIYRGEWHTLCASKKS